MDVEKKWKSKYATNLLFDTPAKKLDSYAEYIEDIVNYAKWMARNSGKIMAYEPERDESHITLRSDHIRQAAKEAKKLAKGLGLNENLAYYGMLLHDSGHSFYAHEGEQMLKIIGELKHVGYYHHNATGVDVLLGENTLEKAVNEILREELADNEEAESIVKQLKEEIYYFLDVVVSHDGEATKKDEKNLKRKNYSNIREAVLDKVRTANSKNQYKCLAETPEGYLAKTADVIAYIRTDLKDAFETRIVTDFDEEYLEVLGTILADEDKKDISKEEKIKLAKDIIHDIKINRIRETSDDISDENSQEILTVVDSIIKEINKAGVNSLCIPKENAEQVKEISTPLIEEYVNNKIAENGNVDPNYKASLENKVESFLKKETKIRRAVADEIMTRVQEKLREDFIKNSIDKPKEEMGFSKEMERAFYQLKKLDYGKYVQFCKPVYINKTMPKAVYDLIEDCTNELIKTGIIRDKMYDEAIRNKIKNKKVLDYMVAPYRDEKQYDKKKRELGIRRMRNTALKNRPHKIQKASQKFKSTFMKRKMCKNQIVNQIYNFADDQTERIALACEDIYEAIPTTVTSLIRKATKPDYKKDYYLEEEETKEVNRERKRISNYFKNIDASNLTKDQIQEYIDSRIEEERKKIEEKLAYEIVIKYIGGTTDRTVKRYLVETEHISKRKFKKESKLNSTPNPVVAKLKANVEDSISNEKTR